MCAVRLGGIALPVNLHCTAAMTTARLFYNYLRISPSYAAGCVYRQRAERRKLNRHGARVLACVDRYRDVHKTCFSDWVSGPGAEKLVRSHLMPEVVDAAKVAIGHQSDLFIRFPFGRNAMPHMELLSLISAMVPSAAKELAAVRMTPVLQKNLWRDVYLSYLIKNYPDLELWRLGAEAMLVDRFIGRVQPTGRRMNASQDYERRLLVATVVRHRAWAANIAEHAAVDEFPCKEPLPKEQQRLDWTGVDLLPLLVAHSQEEAMNARQQVIRCAGAQERISATPSFKHQGLLF